MHNQSMPFNSFNINLQGNQTCIFIFSERNTKRLNYTLGFVFNRVLGINFSIMNNIEAFKALRFIPKALHDVSKIDYSSKILGSLSNIPCAIAPTGAVGFGWRGGDVAIAKAAAQFNIPYCLSTTATASIEEIANQAPGRHWFQAYILKDKDLFEKLIQRAKDADYEALMITIDLPVGGKRERDYRNDFKIPFEINALSAHRTPEKMISYGQEAHERGIQVIIAGAGGAAHLPGMIAATSPLPIIGVPVKSSNSIDGWDSVLSILQMPGGVPVATVALNGAKNAGILAAQILGSSDKEIQQTIIEYKKSLKVKVMDSSKNIK